MAVSGRAYWEAQLREHGGLQGVGYVALGRGFNTWMYRVRKTVFMRCARPIVRGGASSVLDVGSGTGFYVDLWKRLGVADITGSDLTDAAVRRLRERHSGMSFERFDLGGTAAPPFEDCSFDAVSAFDVLFHIVDDGAYRRALETIHRLLRPGGTLLLSENFLHGKTLRSPSQVSRSLEEIGAALQRTGFEVLERRPAMVLMNAPVDSEGRLLQIYWGLLSGLISRVQALGWVAGAMLYPLDVTLCLLMREGPTTEVMTCRRL